MQVFKPDGFSTENLHAKSKEKPALEESNALHEYLGLPVCTPEIPFHLTWNFHFLFQRFFHFCFNYY
jgi:hypothetical protein